MPKYIERPDLPEPIIRALTDNYYMEGLVEHFDSIPPDIRKKFSHHFSVTTLARPARQRVLFNRLGDKVILDPLADGFWRMFGHVIHGILEKWKGPNDLVEQRLGLVIQVQVGRKKVPVYFHGQADLYNKTERRIDDYKITKAESMYYSNKDEYIFQLNALAYIFRQNRLPVEKIRNVYLFRNYDARRYKEGGKYPNEQVTIMDIPIWNDERILKLIHDKAVAHLLAEAADNDHLPLCGPADRWQSETAYKAYKVDPKTGERQKRAKFQSEIRMEVDDWLAAEPKIDAKNKPVAFEVVTVPGRSIRCDYCEIAQFCSQRKEELAAIAAQGGQDDYEDMPD